MSSKITRIITCLAPEAQVIFVNYVQQHDAYDMLNREAK
jgi:mRNA-degrading endonuclease HigB of HigAB toxin-antitoxin module